MSDTLQKIIAYKREEVAARKAAMATAQMRARAAAASPTRGFATAIAAQGPKPALIAEIKRASPSKGLIRADFDPAAIARAYHAGGATCLSVLTDEPSFQGKDAFLAQAREAAPLPALRKDFMIDPWQIAESRALGADAILIILACTEDALARDLAAEAQAWSMDVLIECHDEDEVERALMLPFGLIGVNNRNLRTFETDLATTERLATLIPKDRILVAESGIAAAADLRRLQVCGARAFLVGESLMRQADIAGATRALLA